MPLIKAYSLKRPPARILLIAMRFLGDALLTTPLIHSLKQAFPEAKIDILIYRNTAGMFEGNPDINRIIATPHRPKFRDYLEFIPRIFRRYDLALAVQAGDRPFIYSLIAAPCRVGAVPPKGATGWWKRYFLNGYAEHDNEHTHTVLQNLKLADALRIPRSHALIPPHSDSVKSFLLSPEYAVLHPYPQWTYKQWTKEGWLEIGRYLRRNGMRLVLSGGPGAEEIGYLNELQSELPKDTLNLAGCVPLGELAGIIARARCFVGPDTGITHLAAATGIPVVALFGPTNPVKWTPWPYGYGQDKNPFEKCGDRQVNNVYLIQGEGDCVPCDLEGCERHRSSRSECLRRLPAQRVIEAIRQVLQ
ncbi:glycosyltransferase family 9 protein [Methylomicrobium sp. RS1]|jgi:heptosyltransferase-3|uniref:glycosyltransferase family 9 protein n=1 Tax=Candidatus Methylomicrobium oryzae TaxID=2802053 RepID=UPI0019222AC8|nr:glycosyltransferase family 9 protein [Methylomicrobium sp. RS1]MBL1265034.1 glycosyltransferase family 9 protein [Methylomicrobium sp. RS1]